MIIILFLLTKILWTFLCQRRVKEIIFRSLDLVPSHAHRNCNDFIFYSGYMAGSLLMYLYICNNLFQRRQWHPTPVRLLGKSHGRRSLVGSAVHGVAKSRTRLRDFTSTFHFHALEKEMATHSSVLAWRIPGTGEPGGLLSMGSHRVGHDWSDSAAEAIMYSFYLNINYFL